MKKLFCMALSMIMVLCMLTGCGSKEQVVQSFVKDHWGKTPDAMIEQLTLSKDSTVTSEINGLNSNAVQITNASLAGLEFNMLLLLNQWGEDESGIESIRFVFAEKADRDKLYDMIAADPDYIRLQNYEGLYGAKHLSKEDADWLTKYTPCLIGEDGVYQPLTRIMDGKLVRTTVTVVESEQQPLIYLQKREDKVGSPKRYYLEVVGTVFNDLEHKTGIEQTFPDGFPTVLE